MKDYLHKLLKFVSYYRWPLGSLFVVAILWASCIGCEPRAVSPITGKKVTQGELIAEVEVETEKLKAVSWLV